MSIPGQRHIQRHEHFIHSSCTQWSVGIFWPNETYFTNPGFPEIRGPISLSLTFWGFGSYEVTTSVHQNFSAVPNTKRSSSKGGLLPVISRVLITPLIQVRTSSYPFIFSHL